MPFDERHAKVKELGLCFRCMNKDCYARKCKHLCSGCENGRHHILLCKKKLEMKTPIEIGSEGPAFTGLTSAKSHSSFLMQLARVSVPTRVWARDSRDRNSREIRPLFGTQIPGNYP